MIASFIIYRFIKSQIPFQVGSCRYRDKITREFFQLEFLILQVFWFEKSKIYFKQTNAIGRFLEKIDSLTNCECWMVGQVLWDGIRATHPHPLPVMESRVEEKFASKKHKKGRDLKFFIFFCSHHLCPSMTTYPHDIPPPNCGLTCRSLHAVSQLVNFKILQI